MTEVKAYKPICCNKAMLHKSSVSRHEKKCLKNPANKSCLTCEFYTFEWETYYNPYHGGNPGSTDTEYKTFWCNFDEENPVQINFEFGDNAFKRDCVNHKLKIQNTAKAV